MDCEESRYECEIAGNVDATRPVEQEAIAEACAENYFSCHDGSAGSWPQDVSLFLSETGDRIASVHVYLDMSYTFTGRLNDSGEVNED